MLSFFKQLGLGHKEGEPNGKKLTLPLLLGLAILGVALLLFGGTEKKQTESKNEAYVLEEDELILYQEHLEKRVQELCASVQGVGEVTVVVTLAGGFSSEYATQWRDGNQEYVILGSGSSASGLFLSRSAPEIAGIGVVCHGGASAQVRQELTALLCAAFDLSSNRIYVTAAKK